MEYQEPVLTVAILDYCKPIESRLCLESVKRHIKFPHKVIFCDNGSQEDYPVEFLKQGLIDQLIINRDSMGLGLGTRDIFAVSFSPYTLSLQNDQLFGRDFTWEDFQFIASRLGSKLADDKNSEIASISLAGSPCGKNTYSERAHIIVTNFYKQMESRGLLKHYGAGPWHDGEWREASIQRIYKENNFVHWQPPVMPWVIDNGVYAVRDMKEGGVWCHRTDNKALWCIVNPIIKNPAYPKLSNEEFELAKNGQWLDGKIPEAESKDSFDCWSNTQLAKMEKEYIADLRRRFKTKK